MRSRARFSIALLLAAALGAWLLYTSIGGTLEKYVGPAQLTGGGPYRLNAVVSPGAPRDAAARALAEQGLRFVAQDKKDPARRVTIEYRGELSDTFQSGRQFVVSGRMKDGVFVAKRDSLVTQCPSKFQAKTHTPKPT